LSRPYMGPRLPYPQNPVDEDPLKPCLKIHWNSCQVSPRFQGLQFLRSLGNQAKAFSYFQYAMIMRVGSSSGSPELSYRRPDWSPQGLLHSRHQRYWTYLKLSQGWLQLQHSSDAFAHSWLLGIASCSQGSRKSC
jgi:hypothetical protein